MSDDYLIHYGIKGMKWGVRRTDAQLAAARGETLKTTKSDKKTSSSSKSTTSPAKKAVSSVTSKAKKVVSSAQKKSEEKKTKKAEKKAEKQASKKKLKDMTDEEIQERIARLELEKKYKSLSNERKSAGQKYLENVLSKSTENIGVQLATYLVGTGVNETIGKALFNEAIVNPKKGQKDK